MQTTLAQQLIIFSFTAALFMMSLVGAIMCMSILRLMRLQRLELVYIQVNSVPVPAQTIEPQPVLYQSQYDNRSTRHHRPKFNVPSTTQVDIQISAPDSAIMDSPYKPRPITHRSEKIG